MANILQGTNVAFKIDDAGGTERDMTSFWVDGMPDLGNAPQDTTVFGDLSERNEPGMQTASWSVTLQQNSSGTASPWTVMTGLLGGTVTDAKFYPEGDASGRPEVVIPMRVVNIAPGGGVGEVGVFTAELVVDGTRTVGTV